MTQSIIRINGDRLLDDLRTLRGFGACGTGVVRRSLSAVDMESRHWLVGRMRDAGLEADIDGMGTVLGRSGQGEHALLLGSHTDTQPEGGWLDGALGVIYGLEVARALAESDATADLAVDVASWIDEEGNFSGLLGSRAYCGELADEVMDDATNDEGTTLREALETAGLEGRPRFQLDPERYVGYLEAHIEQGPYLEEERNRIGVVTGIVGIRGYEISFDGEQNHAGTTPMARRKDAVSALIKLGHAINTEFLDIAGRRTVWTIGQLAAFPGAMAIIPGKANMVLQMRDADESRLDVLAGRLHDLVRDANDAGPVSVTIRQTTELAPALMDEGLQRHLSTAAEAHAASAWTRMPSAAGHDAQVLARHLPAAMLFIPSIGGLSHAFGEDTDEKDIVLGCHVLATAAASILRAHGGQAGD
jgi:N-carbamoyl-L-amino-acid hydrolase